MTTLDAAVPARVAPLDPASDRVVVVGGGVAAVSLCAALRGGGFAGPLSVLESGGTPHDRPPLSKTYLAGDLQPAELELQPAPWWQQQQVELLTGVRATSLRRQPDGSLAVHAESGGEQLERTADRVVLATGGEPAIPAVPGGEHALTLRSREDADRLRPRLRPGRTVVVIGAGLIGSEVAATARQLGCQVTVVDPRVPMQELLGPELAVWLHLLHRQRGITMVADVVQRIAADAVHVPGGILSADTVVLAVGLAPLVPLDSVGTAGPGPEEELVRAGDGAVVVSASGATSVPGVLAIGDCSARTGTAGIAGARSAGHWESARSDGEDAARALLGQPPVERGPAWFWSDRHGHHLEVLGSMAAAEEVAVRGVLGEPPFSVLGLAAGVLVAAASVDDPAMIKMARRLVQRAVPVEAGTLADPSTDLRRLARGR